MIMLLVAVAAVSFIIRFRAIADAIAIFIKKTPWQ
jgi:uncharacterized membrane protein